MRLLILLICSLLFVSCSSLLTHKGLPKCVTICRHDCAKKAGTGCDEEGTCQDWHKQKFKDCIPQCTAAHKMCDRCFKIQACKNKLVKDYRRCKSKCNRGTPNLRAKKYMFVSEHMHLQPFCIMPAQPNSYIKRKLQGGNQSIL